MWKYFVSLRIGIKNSMQYRFDFLVGIISTLFPIVIQIFLWKMIYENSDSNNKMYGFNFSQMMVYISVAATVSQFINSKIEYKINDDIKTGFLSNYLIKPISYVPYRVFETIGQKLSSFITLIVYLFIAIAILYFTVGYEIYFKNIFLFIISLLLATALNFFMFFLISSLAFHLTEIERFFHSITVIIMVISGGVFPITIFGDSYVSILKFLPFNYTSYFPITIMSGVLNDEELIFGLSMQILYIFIFYVFSKISWNVGIKKFVAVGG